MDINVYSICHRGNVRDKNRDNYYCNGVIPDTENSNFRYGGSFEASAPLLFGVFDGMDGHLHGERASRYAVEACCGLFPAYQGGNPYKIMKDICEAANKRICDEMENVVKGRMGSTASMLLFEQGGMYVCNLGDSPVFIVRDGKIRQISLEHTERHSYEKAYGKDFSGKKKYRLTKYLGVFPNENELTPYNYFEQAQAGDRFLICSDGVTDMMKNDEIAGVVSSGKTVEKAAENLLEAALKNGGNDNITLIIGEISGDVPENPDGGFFVDGENAQSAPDEPSKQSKGNIAMLIAAIAMIITALIIAGTLIFGMLNKPHTDNTSPTSVSASQTATH